MPWKWLLATLRRLSGEKAEDWRECAECGRGAEDGADDSAASPFPITDIDAFLPSSFAWKKSNWV